jgi:hypothetical protein
LLDDSSIEVKENGFKGLDATAPFNADAGDGDEVCKGVALLGVLGVN